MRRTLLILGCILLFAQAAMCSVCNEIKQYTLPNGQTVIIKEVKNNPIVIIDTFVKTGSINENDKNNGVAHFLEHLFFKGTTNHKRGEFERLIERRGGVFNAATSRDYTHYYIKIDSKYFEEALSLHADMLLNIAIPQNEMDTERKVVTEEITRSADNPDNKVFDNFMQIVFNGTPYARKILGTNDIIKNISRDEVLAFHQAWYEPKNMVTVIVGDVDAKKILPKISKYFAHACPAKFQANALPQPENPPLKQIKNRTIIEKSDTNTAYLILGYPSAGVNNLKEAYALGIAASIFAGGQNSILYKVLKQDENLAIAIGAGNYELKDRGVFYVDATFAPQNYEKILSKIKTELNKLKETTIDENRIALVKNAEKRSYEYASESVSSLSNILGYDVAVGNGISDYTNYLATINSITPEYIKETLNKYLKDDKLAISVLLPKSYKKSLAKQNILPVSYKKTEKAKLISTFKNIKKFKLSNGATLIYEKNPNNNVVATKIFIKGGSLAEQKAGTADILSATIKKGTSKTSGKELEDKLDNIGTSVSISDEFEYFEVSMKTTKDDFPSAFLILKEIIEEPLFNQNDVDNAKSDAIHDIKGIKDSPHSIAFENFNNDFYANSPFLKTGKILEKTIPTIIADDVKKLHKETFSPENMIISVVGNIDENSLISAFSSFKQLPTKKFVDDKILKSPLSDIEKNIITKEGKNAKGAWIIQGWKTKGLSSNDFITLKVISTYLGSGFTSKLFVNLREEKGLAYEVGSGSSSAFNHGKFFMYIGTNPENINEVIKGFNKEIQDLKTKKISEKELCDVKSMLIGKLKLSTETNMSRAFMNGYYEFFDKGYRFGYDYPELIQKVSSDDIINVASKIFSKPYIMSIVAEEKYLE